MKKILIIVPHLSTGGMPQYLLKKILAFQNQFEMFVVEYNNFGKFDVQKKKIIEAVGKDNHFNLNIKSELISIIDDIQPDIIQFEEIPEYFVDSTLLEKIFNNRSKYNIVTTTHSSQTDPLDLKYHPDRFLLVSEWSKSIFEEKLDIPCDVWEYPIENYDLSKRDEWRNELFGEFGDVKHVINVGLFTSGKNQGEIMEVARKFKDKPIMFHFIGNQASNFESYWGPLMKNLPNNCKVWGERHDVEKFYIAGDLFYFSSVLELNPLVVKESLSYKLPIILKKLDTYLNIYDDHSLVAFIDGDLDKTKNIIERKLDIGGVYDFKEDLFGVEVNDGYSNLISSLEGRGKEGWDNYWSQIHPRCFKHDGVVIDAGCLKWDWSQIFLGKKRLIGLDPQEEPIEGAELYKGILGPLDGKGKFGILNEDENKDNVGYSEDGELVDMISFKTLCKKYNIDKVSILKLNIEGAEYSLLNSMDVDDYNKIDQIAVGFHDWLYPNQTELRKNTLVLLENMGFEVRKIHDYWNWYLAIKKLK